jgi:uncharacterized protein (DUF305 family)
MTTLTLMRRTAWVTATATAALILSACGGDNSSSSGVHEGHNAAPSGTSAASADATAGAKNPQDVRFAQGMIPHHQQAVEMARLAPGHASSPKVKDLASRIEKAQDPEIRTMTDWLKSWGEPVSPSWSPSPMESMPGMSPSAHYGMPGMMTAKDMDALKKASGRDFDTKFLTMMVEHHKGAVDMAATEKDEGEYGPAKAMAAGIITGQNAEIAEMNKLLGKS